jgi:hypothetical protein
MTTMTLRASLIISLARPSYYRDDGTAELEFHDILSRWRSSLDG